MGVEADVGLDDLEALISSGKIPADADVTEIAALLAGHAPAADKAAGEGDADDDAGADGKGDAKAVDDKAKADAAAATDDKKGGSDTSGAAQNPELEGPIVSDTGRTIPFGVLRGTREQLRIAQDSLRRSEEERQQEAGRNAQLTAEIATLRAGTAAARATAADVQEVADQAGVVDRRGNKVDVTKIDVAALRGEFPEAVVTIIEQLQSALVAQDGTIRELRTRDAHRVHQEELSDEQKLQADIDAVPFLATIQADEKPHRWAQAIALDKSLQADPDFKDKSRQERFEEIARLMDPEYEDPAAAATGKESAAAAEKKPAATSAQVREKVQGALQRAAARAAPTSLTDLPAGSAAAQSEAESVEALDPTELAVKMQSMTPAQMDAYLARHA